MIDQTINEHCALRLYFPTSAKARRTRFWHRLGAPSLSHHLLMDGGGNWVRTLFP
jgi:hypothetical protein